MKLFKKSFGTLVEQFANYNQQDAHEFLTNLLNQLEEELIVRLDAFFIQSLSTAYIYPNHLTSATTKPNNLKRDLLMNEFASLIEEVEVLTTEAQPVTIEDSDESNHQELEVAAEGKSNVKSPDSISNLPPTAKKDVARDDIGDTKEVHVVSSGSSSDCKHMTLSPQSQSNNTSSLNLHTPGNPSEEPDHTISSTAPNEAKAVVNAKKTSSTNPLPKTKKLMYTYEKIHEISTKLVPTSQLFNTMIEINMICEHCSHQLPPKYESYHDFSLNLTPPSSSIASAASASASATLQSLLDAFFADEYIDTYYCLKCQSPKEHNRVKLCKSIIHLAPMIILQLKRFQYNPMTQELTKIEQEIDFQTQISFKSYLKDTNTTSSSSVAAVQR